MKPRILFNDKNLTRTDTDLLSLIISLTLKNDYCFATNKYLANYIIGGLVSLVLLDIVTTLSTLFNLKDKLEEAKLLAEKISEEGKDKAKNSEVIKQLEEVKNSIINKTNFLHDRIIDAFPKLEFKKYKIQFGELKEGITKKKQNKKDKNKKDKKSK